METVVMWVLGGYGVFLLGIAGVIMRMSTQTAVLQKTVDGLVSRVDLFLKTEVDSVKELTKQITEALTKQAEK